MKFRTRVAGLLAVTLGLSYLDAARCPTWPKPGAPMLLGSLFSAPVEPVNGADDEAVRELPVCIASQSWSAGELGSSVLYHAKRVGHRLYVGYFVYWSTERPWGKNLLSYLVVPALFVDSFYSHLFFLFPGAQRMIHGPGDIEGARVVYEEHDDGRWEPVAAVADDGMHQEVALTPDDFVDDKGRVVFMTNVWSHQLGARGARSFVEGQRDSVACFDHDRLAPLTNRVAQLFRLGTPAQPRRAPPAWRL